jgi:3'-phosphoadenosine 5'-phosphosulfate sulfotransferase (PAPS reductase)/FAD synthetase
MQPKQSLNISQDVLDELNERLSHSSAEDRVSWAVETLGEGAVMTTSFGVQSAVMLHLGTSLTLTLTRSCWIVTHSNTIPPLLLPNSDFFCY